MSAVVLDADDLRRMVVYAAPEAEILDIDTGATFMEEFLRR